ncbi:Nucleotide-binding universal stress protein, UspA family [Salinihabitans flavidus]|uniref:Nucleotide-binding universal stress protein, UspA family n=1 Tax=Salinihabitans flavidus TaxID=569882 RepID=A0A1H8LFQ7_9RHOB|nr:universal stress protein [Salinihabitans flavidus]SEO03598.1 Nucleotide-binding universal stress protein, UspA family [Salinihabitans flavidus]
MYKSILIPVSFDEDRETDTAMDVARMLADKGADITLLHVMEKVPSYAVDYFPEGYREEARRAVEGALNDLAARLPGAHGVVTDGHAGRGILDYAAEIGADCIIVASHKPGLQDYFLGSTAAHVVRHAHCAVHVLR